MTWKNVDDVRQHASTVAKTFISGSVSTSSLVMWILHQRMRIANNRQTRPSKITINVLACRHRSDATLPDGAKKCLK